VPRTVTLVLVGSDGTLLGALRPFEVTSPWWQDVREVVGAARGAHGVDVTILRVLESGSAPPGGDVRYLAEIDGEPPDGLVPTGDGVVSEHPLRQPWARPGGPRSDLRWADEQLRRIGTPRSGPAEQVRTWNLSSLWRLPTTDGGAWLKVVPPFFAHEGDVVARVAIGPPLLAHDGARSLLGEVPGDDLHAPNAEQVVAMVRLLVSEQVRWCDRTDELLTLGAPDWRAAPLAALAADVIERTAPELDEAVVARARDLVAGWSERFRAIASCGVPDSLVHGDFHGGNVRADGGRMVVLDWGDCGLGNPLLDEAAAAARLTPPLAALTHQAFVSAWRDAVPGCDPTRAADLLRPVAALRQAVIYRQFLDRIEPAEHAFHRDDPAHWIAAAARLHGGSAHA
jgi:hypothetical protein